MARFAVFAVAVLITAPLSLAQKPNVQIKITTSDADGIVAIGDTVTFTAKLSNRSKTPIKGRVRWQVHTVAFDPPQSVDELITIEAGGNTALTHRLTLPSCGFADLECRFAIDGVENVVSRRSRIGAATDRVLSKLTREDDFDAFWKQSLAELQNVDPKFSVIPKPERAQKGIDVFEVSMRSFGDVTVRGWLEIPRTKGPHPAVIRVPGYGQNMKPIGRWDDMIVFSFNPRGHGNSQDDVSGKPQDYWIRGLDSKDDYFYRGAYLDCVRAVDFIASRSDVDQKRIAVWGGSQGGGFAFATAALDSRIDFCAADIPFLCDWHNYFKLTHWPEMDKWIEQRKERTWEKTLQTMSYFDTMNLCDRIHCPTVMGVGLQDQVCPPTTCFAAFNRIAAQKSHKVYAAKGHGLGSAHWNWVWLRLRTEFALTNGE